MWGIKQMYTNYQPNHRIRLNPQPPSGANYFDPSMLMCAPCQSGAVNYCQSVTQPSQVGGDVDWLFESPKGPMGAAQAPVAAGVSDCCTTELDPLSGLYKTTCDTQQGCGWVAGPFLTEEMSCKFTTSGATYSTFDECLADNPPTGSGVGTQIDWFPPCGMEQVQNCYYPNVDACLPAVFGKAKQMAAEAAARQAAAHQAAAHQAAAHQAAAHQAAACSMYVCDGTYTMDAAGRRSFPSSSCRCLD
jgi:hypothetical protein